MSRKFYFSFLVAAAVFMAGHLVIFAQDSPVAGTVELKKADGTIEPVAGALIEVYRTDIKGGFPSATTDSKGQFRFAAMPYNGVYTFAVSAPNCAPSVFPNVKSGQEKLLIVLSPGNGKKFSESEARSFKPAKTGEGSGELTEEEKKAKADFDKKAAEIEAKNAKATKTNEIITAAAKDAKDAFDAKNYDLAIAKYEEGIAADPEFVGSAPVFNNNRSISLRIRAVDTRNTAIKLTDATEKFAALEKAKKDLADSAAGFLRAWNILNNAPATDIVDRTNYEATKTAALVGAQETFRMAVLTEQVDPSVIEAAKVLTPAYVAVEPDATKKATAKLIFADLYRVAGDSENAIASYKAILETSPENVDALVGLGLSLVNYGYIKDDKVMLQEAANYLQKFVSLAPDSHKFKANAAEAITTLKTLSNVAPQKVQSGGKKKP
ncbi:MAG: carboxypeptidase regulatory-like domain-containing protein [Chloracidobacterium sp.]|nr:carboxypeptidase regulatory-like domain-containing protein [Chloracidobacterium sp.]